jgi:ABC-2 type transport system permease protein
MFQIIKNEFHYWSKTRWLSGISLGFVTVLLLSVFLGNYQNQIQTENYQTAQKHVRKQWESIKEMNPHGAAHYGTYIFKPTNLLSSLDEGVNSITGNVLRVEGHVQNEIVHSEASQMQTISKFGKLKSSLLLQFIVPILLIFLAFSSISNEKQSGRLKLLLLQGASPNQIMFAKTLSVWLYGVGLLTLSIALYAVFNVQNIDNKIIERTFFFFTSYSFYYFIISGLTVFFSARWQNPTLALTSMLGIWIVWTIFLPNILMSSVEKWHPLPSRNEMQTAMKEDRSKGIDGHNPSDEREKEFEKQVLKKYGVDSISQLPINFDGLVMQADEEYGNVVWDKHFGNLKTVLSQQKQTYQLGGVFNPFVSLQNASMGFTGSDNLHHQDFLVQVENYRRVFIKMLNDKHAFGGSKTGDWDWKADNAFFKSVPDFAYKPTSISAILPNYILDVGLLAFWVIATTVLLVFGAKKLQTL